MAKSLIEAINDIAANLPPGSATVNMPPRDAVGLWMEEALLVYCVGEGTFSDDTTPTRATINLMMDIYDFTGRWIGYQQGVHLSFATAQDLFTTPPPPPPPFDAPSPVPTQDVKEWTKGLWSFADGSAVYAVGPAQSHLVPLKDGSFMFMVTTGQVLAGGIGRYKDCVGIKSATGSVHVPAGLLQSGKFPSPGLKFQARTVENFRIGLKEYVRPLPPGFPGGGPPAEAPSEEEGQHASRGGKKSAS